MWNFDWFDKWNRENPTDVYGPAIVLGAAFGAVLVAALVIAWGYPAQTTTIQTGPRGAGMGVVKFASVAAAGDPTAADYVTSEPYKPEEGAALAKDVYQNVQVLGDLTEDNFTRVMEAITEWVSPEEGCAYCHAEGEDLAADTLYTKKVARRMIQMTQAINSDWDLHVGATGVNCYTCHRGQHKPSGAWYRIAPALERVKGWSANQNLATAQSSFTSLPHDALEKLLVADGQIKVHDLEPRVNNEGTASIQDTERTYALMNHFSLSLGANCTFCHNSRAFYDGAQVTPQWGTASLGIQMVRDINTAHIAPVGELLPADRLGPKYGDPLKVACMTCHKGHNKPLGGLSMVKDWPELAAPGAPSYE